MRRTYLAIAAIMAIGLSVPLDGCSSLESIKAGITVAPSASVTRNQVKLLVDGTKTLSDLATTYINGCVAAQSVTGACAPKAIDAIHNAITATIQPRKNLVAFAQAHAGAELGASGLYDALQTAKDSLASVLKQYGYAVPS